MSPTGHYKGVHEPNWSLIGSTWVQLVTTKEYMSHYKGVHEPNWSLQGSTWAQLVTTRAYMSPTGHYKGVQEPNWSLQRSTWVQLATTREHMSPTGHTREYMSPTGHYKGVHEQWGTQACTLWSLNKKADRIWWMESSMFYVIWFTFKLQWNMEIFHWSLFLRALLTMHQHWFSWRLGSKLTSIHYLNQWWPSTALWNGFTCPWGVYPYLSCYLAHYRMHYRQILLTKEAGFSTQRKPDYPYKGTALLKGLPWDPTVMHAPLHWDLEDPLHWQNNARVNMDFPWTVGHILYKILVTC